MKFKQFFLFLQNRVLDVWFVYSFLIVFLLKLGYLFINSYAVEIDSYGYFVCILHFEYPPVYPYFLYILRNIYPDLFFIAFVQVILFSLSSAILLRYLFNKKQFLLVAAIVMGLEPVTSFLCSNMMSECLFLTVLFPWLIVVHRYFQDKTNSKSKIFLIGVLSGVLYSIRFAGLPFLLFFSLLLVIDQLKRKELFLSLLLLFIGFQATILPLRMKYKILFDSYQINAFTGAVLWNNASTIYLSSKLYKNPETNFEKYLVTRDTTNFSPYNALKGRQLWEFNLPYRNYFSEKGYRFQDYPKASKEVMVTAIKIITDHPFLYFKNFVLPNFLQVFLEDEYQDMSAYNNYFQTTFNAFPAKTVVYHRYYWLFYFALLIISTAIYLLSKNRLLLCKIILNLSWLYVLALPFISILAIRLYFILVPFIVLSLLVQIKSLRELKAFISEEQNGTS